ncbi:hypothetical protein AJ80_03850 [Polytolypa hystricis UAMH7299]|uniref:Peptidase S33 tripeptidyl aminopeptidase-like C-terminal domain-containing protein n=1 Tax=Polytolypa hystricis (strain UAMH7299) TaxID=1447883 RepID=A0A2B7YEJ2_POLH7|nr:hypothetical protein AJ80_03850 [Polytolypa hystricis UAMH7299]
MVLFKASLLLSGLALAHAGPGKSPNIEWGACNKTEVNTSLPMDCSNLHVPLDYTDSRSNKTLRLELARLPASENPSKGSILFNFGGPGIPGRSSLVALASLLQALTGGQYDLIAFDPRGTGNTLPFTCYDNDLEVLAMMDEQILANASDTTMGRLWARASVDAQACFSKANETGSLIGTAFGARDLMSVVDALDEDGMLRYWGLSYGTTLGATVAAMFPDRIDKMILDGVQNPHEYYHAYADFEEWTMSDKVFSGIFSGCVAAPENCALAHGNKTAAELEQVVWDMIDAVKYRPIPLGGGLLDYSASKQVMAQHLYSTSGWPDLAVMLDAMLSGNPQESGPEPDAGVYIDGKLQNSVQLMATMGIHCADRKLRTSSFDEIMPAMNQLLNISRVMGDVTTGMSMACAQWKIEPKERYEGDFQVKTKNPVLFIGNTYDGHTPIISARNVSSGFEGSVVLEVNGYGHCSVALPSKCTLKTVSEYWLKGTLPEPGKVCGVDAPPYSNVTWADVIGEASGNNTSCLLKREVYNVPSLHNLGRRLI